MQSLSGIFPPLPTAFNKDEQFNPQLQAAHIKQLEPNVDGYVILGTNGEAAFLNEEERSQVLDCARQASQKPMIAGTGGESTQLVIKRNQIAADIGIDFVLVLPPFYFKAGMSDAALEKHYLSIAEQSPKPVLLYNMPAATTLSLSPQLIAKLAQHPNIVGLKDSSGNIFALTEIMRTTPTDFMVFTGNAPTLLAALALGAKGGILAVANVVPKHFQALKAAFDKSEMETAKRLQLSLNPIALAVTSHYGVAGLKGALRLQGNSLGYPRAPLLDLDDKALADIQTRLNNVATIEL